MPENGRQIVIGVDIGGTTITSGLLDEDLNIIERVEQRTVTSSQQELIESIEETVQKLKAASRIPISAVGFGIPSMIDQSRGRTVASVNVPLEDFDFVEHMTGRLELPVFIDNDANLAALAEARAGAAAGSRHMVMLTLGTGIGGGIIIDGKVYRGATGSAAELGHMVIDPDGPKCPGACPNYGCFETMASGKALTRYALKAARDNPGSELAQAEAGGNALDGPLLYRLASKGDSAALAVFAEFGFYLGIGITSLVNIFNPRYLVVGGGVIRAGRYILEPAAAILQERGLRPNRDVVTLVPAKFGPEAGLIGAACLALEGLA